MNPSVKYPFVKWRLLCNINSNPIIYLFVKYSGYLFLSCSICSPPLVAIPLLVKALQNHPLSVYVVPAQDPIPNSKHGGQAQARPVGAMSSPSPVAHSMMGTLPNHSQRDAVRCLWLLEESNLFVLGAETHKGDGNGIIDSLVSTWRLRLRPI